MPTRREARGLTWLDDSDCLWLGQLQRCNPALAFHFRIRFQVKRQWPAARNDETARVLRVDESVGEVDRATTSVAYLGWVSAHKSVLAGHTA